MTNVPNLPPFKRMCVTIGNLPSSFMESMTYYEALCWLYDYFEKTLLPAINTNSEAITELQNAFVTLKEYVDNYFDDLNIQTEIDNKLDEMALDGTLADIINNEIFSDLNDRLTAVENKETKIDNTILTNPIFPAVLTKGNHAKAIFYNTTDHKFNIFQKTTGGYLMYELDNATGDTGDTSVGSNWDLIRIKKIQSCLFAYTGKMDYDTYSGTITTLYDDDTTVNAFEQMLFSNGSSLVASGYKKYNKGLRVYGVSAGGSLTYNMKSNLAKKGNVLFYVSSGSSKNVCIKVNNLAVKDNIDLSGYAVTGNNAVLIDFELPAKCSLADYTITVENNDDNSRIAYISCVNFYELKDYNGEYIDSFKGILVDRYYINSGGSSDYAILDADLNKWCGSYHGGETAISQKAITPNPLTGSAVSHWENNYRLNNISSLSTTFYLAPYFIIEQATNINSKAKMLSQFDFTNDGMVDMIFNYYDGTISTKKFYTALTCNTKTFDIIKMPNNEVITNPVHYLNNNCGIAKFTSNSQPIKLNIYYTKFNDNYIGDLYKNGWIDNTVYYNKFYFGVIDNPSAATSTTIENIQFRKIIECIEN